MTILDERNYYRPFNYPWAYDLYIKQTQELYWNTNPIDFSGDLGDYNRLPDTEKKFLREILTFFTQADIDISAHYVNRYIPAFPQPEIRMMLLAAANVESLHVDAYSKLIESLGLGDYKGFLKYPQMVEKHDYIANLSTSQTVPDRLVDVAIGSAFGEGLQLFGSFTMLLSYAERGLFKGMRDVVAWSLRDETMHVQMLLGIFHTLRREYPRAWTDESKRRIYSAARDMVELEDRFISLVYADGLELPNLKKTDLHLYIRYLADHRLGQLGLKPEYYQATNPVEWMGLFTAEKNEDFFTTTVTSYQHSEFDTNSMW